MCGFVFQQADSVYSIVCLTMFVQLALLCCILLQEAHTTIGYPFRPASSRPTPKKRPAPEAAKEAKRLTFV